MTATESRSRWLALYVLCTGMLMIVLDVTIVNVALPSVQEDLDFSPSGLAWVVNAYLIAFGGLLLLAGRLGDLLGRRNVFLAGLVVFTAASVLCGAAQSPAMLVVARFLQGAGGAMTSAVILGMIVTMFPEPRESREGDRRVRVRRVRRRRGRAARRRRDHPGRQLALDLLREPADRHRDRRARRARAARGQGSRCSRRRRRRRAPCSSPPPDARRLHDRRAGRRARLDGDEHARLRRHRGRAADRGSSSGRRRPPCR